MGAVMADYSKQKSGTGVKGAPRHKEHNAPGGPKNPFGARNDKAALVAKLAEAARSKAKEEK
jgi:hypothetical protein